jgi:RES domain
MAKRKGRRGEPPRYSAKKKIAPKPHTVSYLLESGTLQDMRAAKTRTADLLAYQWALYSELEFQRNQRMEDLKSALVSSCVKDFSFSKWQRAVKWKYGLHPLSTVGSLAYIGQRFNVGVDVNPSAASFPALYIAEDKDTALQETLGQANSEIQGLTPQQLALMNPQSEAIVSVSGRLEMALDLRDKKSVTEFVKIIDTFKISDKVKKQAAALGEPSPTLVTDEILLLDSILSPDWRVNPSVYDIPANSQIFGHILNIAGIESVIYPSKQNKKACLAVFTRNFEKSSSFIEFDDDPPLAHMPKRFDSSNFGLFEESKIEITH